MDTSYAEMSCVFVFQSVDMFNIIMNHLIPLSSKVMQCNAKYCILYLSNIRELKKYVMQWHWEGHVESDVQICKVKMENLPF